MNLHDSGRFCTESIESAAKRYKTLGFSIIPLNGARNPQQPKLPMIKWARFQHTYASNEELQTWFGNTTDIGIGIVCGRISRLMVLDFDSAEDASEFRRVHPDLVETFTVCSGTRKLPHFYYRLPEGKLIATSAFSGVDLRAEGSYVVAPPTAVGKAAWTVGNEAPIRALTELDLRRIMRFLSNRKSANPKPEKAADIEVVEQVSEFRRPPAHEDLIRHYRQHIIGGRNNALFRTALVARDGGLTEAAAVAALAGVHASEPGPEHEPYEVRYAEAVHTIASAYSRPARQQANRLKGLGNSIREWFLGHGLTSVARVLDGLYAVGVEVNTMLTELEVCQKLAPLKIGRRSVMAALKAVIGDWHVFGAVVTPLNPPLSANAANGLDTLNNSCKMSSGAKRVKNGRGRPAQLYQLPSQEVIAAKLGVSAISGTILSNEDFGSPKAYRQALHNELLTRRPGYYGRIWLSERLGVSRWTARRYDKAADIIVQPSYTTQTLSWESAALLPAETAELTKGVFIEASDGRRYPAIRGLAFKLLKRGLAPVVKHQQGNFYSAQKVGVGIPTAHMRSTTLSSASSLELTLKSAKDNPVSEGVGIPTRGQGETPKGIQPAAFSMSDNGLRPSTSGTAVSTGVGIPTRPPDELTFWLCPECLNFHIMASSPVGCSRCGVSCTWEIISPRIWRDALALKHWWVERYRDHQLAKRQRSLTHPNQVQQAEAKDANETARVEKLHKQIPGLSFRNARKLVRQFSEQLIERALAVIRTRGQLRSPAGFLITFLRSEHRLLSSNNKILPSNPNKKGESAVDWLRRLAKSEYLSFISNVDELLNLALDGTQAVSEA